MTSEHYLYPRRLPGLTNRLVSEILRVNSNTVIVNQSGTPVEMPWVDEANTLVQVCCIRDCPVIQCSHRALGILWWQRARERTCRYSVRKGQSIWQAAIDVPVSCTPLLTSLSHTSAHESRKRLEDNPSFPSFGDKGQELGKILYNEVRPSLLLNVQVFQLAK